MKLFLSYKFKDQQFVELVYYILSRQGLELFYWPLHGQARPLTEELRRPIDDADDMIAFLGAEWGGTQEKEVEYFLANRHDRCFVAVQLVPQISKDVQMALPRWGMTPIEGLNYNGAKELSKKIAHLVGRPWVPEDGLPNRYVVAYEKKFLEICATTMRSCCESCAANAAGQIGPASSAKRPRTRTRSGTRASVFCPTILMECCWMRGPVWRAPS